MKKQHPCPTCGKMLNPCGVATIDPGDGSEPEELPVYQCETCTRDWVVGKSRFKTLMTFAVDPEGRALDPDTGRPMET